MHIHTDCAELTTQSTKTHTHTSLSSASCVWFQQHRLTHVGPSRQRGGGREGATLLTHCLSIKHHPSVIGSGGRERAPSAAIRYLLHLMHLRLAAYHLWMPPFIQQHIHTAAQCRKQLCVCIGCRSSSLFSRNWSRFIIWPSCVLIAAVVRFSSSSSHQGNSLYGSRAH